MDEKTEGKGDAMAKKKAAAAAPLFLLLLFLPKLTSSARSLHPFGSHTLSNQQIRRRGRAARVAACWYVEKKTNKKESLEALSPSSFLPPQSIAPIPGTFLGLPHAAHWPECRARR
jgi:hypothetical protein